MIYSTKKEEWFKIEKFDELQFFLNTYWSQDGLTVGRVFEDITRYGHQNLGIVPPRANTADYIAQRINILSKVALNVHMGRKNIIDGFSIFGFVWINARGGYNFIEGLVPAEELIPFFVTSEIVVEKPILRSRILFLENDQLLENSVLHEFQRTLHKRKYPLPEIELFSQVTMLREATMSGVLMKAIHYLIERHGKLILCFATTQEKLESDQLLMFEKFKPYIEQVIYRGDPRIGKQLLKIKIPASSV